MSGSPGVSAALIAMALACGDDAGPSAPDAALADAGAAPEMIAPAAPPVLEPCPAAWRLDQGRCVGPDAPETCPPGTAAFVDAEGCSIVGDACPAGEFAELPADAAHRVYVRPGATGTGSIESPLGTIAAAMRTARPDTAIALAPGTYAETLDVIAGVTVIGACAERTILAPPSGSTAVWLDELGVGLENVTVRPPGEIGISVLGRAELEGVVIEGARVAAVLVRDGATLSGSDVVIRGTVGEGRVLEAGDGSTVTLSRLVLEDNDGGLLASGPATLTLDRVRARRNSRSDVGLFTLQDGAEVVISTLAASENIGPLAVAFAASLTLEDAALSAVKGILASEESELVIRRASFVDSIEFVVTALEGSTVALDDVLARNVSAGGSATGIGLFMGSRCSLVARRLDVSGCAGAGLAGVGLRTDMSIGPGATLDVEDLRIARTGGGSGENAAIVVQHGSTGSFARVRLEESSSAGVIVSGAGSDATFTDLVLRETASRANGTFGRAFEVQIDAHASVARSRIERSHEVSVMAISRARLELEHVAIVESQERGCAASTCADSPGGSGLGVYDGAIASATDLEIDGARLCGVQIATGASLDLRGGSIANATIGACVQVEGYDLARVTDGVAFRDNGTNVDTAEHSIPEPGVPLTF